MSSFQFILWAILVAATMFVFPQVFILLIVGLSPSVAAFLIDRSPRKYATFCVSGMNIAGVFPAFLNLLNGDNSISGVKNILTNPFEMTIMFAAAALGWLIYFAVPPVIKSLLTVIAQHRIGILRGEQRKLIKDWGEGIAVGPQAIYASQQEEPTGSEPRHMPNGKDGTGDASNERGIPSDGDAPDTETKPSD